jgi:hypothetical protein
MSNASSCLGTIFCVRGLFGEKGAGDMPSLPLGAARAVNGHAEGSAVKLMIKSGSICADAYLERNFFY